MPPAVSGYGQFNTIVHAATNSCLDLAAQPVEVSATFSDAVQVVCTVQLAYTSNTKNVLYPRA